MFSIVENKQALEALQAVRDVESRAAATPSTWPMTVAASALLGLMVFCAKQELWWWAFGFFVAAIAAPVAADRRRRGVRLAMKQQVRPDEWLQRGAFLPSMFVPALIIFTPTGNVWVSGAVAAATAVGAMVFSYRELRRP
ncbi:hypothetical protein [Corynebacterium mayonis]|uniref:hypothetical protein n=1 Tax=Corynebacterium mayonis TaxID=3062461 RepID=UPI0031407C1C